MKYFFLLLFSCTSFLGSAQKETTSIIDGKEIKTIMISSDEVFRVSITAAPVDEITISTKSDGEYFNNISLEAEVKGNTLLLTSRYREILQSGFDKLSAHKVFAMEVLLEVPQNLNVEITSNLAAVIGKGDYNKLFVQLKSGFCTLENFTGNAVINTYDGNVEVETEDASIEANSRHGKVDIPENSFGAHSIQITTINGDIRVKEN
ncbi:hypothetical protein [Salinimicrobium sp. GXAS 041]|uniref:hypothetical protein n=1 Tax=Salinimicrobium sp. GXAS 041 TaxID=3400806 RepID=UPI003C785431